MSSISPLESVLVLMDPDLTESEALLRALDWHLSGHEDRTDPTLPRLIRLQEELAKRMCTNARHNGSAEKEPDAA